MVPHASSKLLKRIPSSYLGVNSCLNRELSVCIGPGWPLTLRAMCGHVGNCEEELPKKLVGRLSVNCRPTDGRQVLPEI